MVRCQSEWTSMTDMVNKKKYNFHFIQKCSILLFSIPGGGGVLDPCLGIGVPPRV